MITLLHCEPQQGKKKGNVYDRTMKFGTVAPLLKCHVGTDKQDENGKKCSYHSCSNRRHIFSGSMKPVIVHKQAFATTVLG